MKSRRYFLIFGLLLAVGLTIVGSVFFSKKGSDEGLTVNQSIKYYDLDGTNTKDIVDSMRSNGPTGSGNSRHYFAYTRWYIQWHYRYASDNGIYWISRSWEHLEISYDMPRLKSFGKLEKPLREKWNRFYEVLKLHEDGHAENGRACAEEIDRKLKTTQKFSSRESLEAYVKKECEMSLSTFREADREYDDKTKHGATQGATF